MRPTTYAEGRATFYGNALVGAGIATGLAALLIVAILTWGGWPSAHFGAIIAILGKALTGAGAVMVLVIVFLGLGGPVRKLRAALGKASIETEGD